MSNRTKLYIFAYDIESDATRLRVASMLEKAGVRVQKSVFEVRIVQPGADAIASRIRELIRPGDSLRVYHVPDSALGNCIVHGGAPLPEAGNFLLF